jgi:hypothetical protein
MADRFEAATSVNGEIWRGVDPAYPGVPQPPPVIAQQSNRTTVDYRDYVFSSGTRQFLYVFIAFAGLSLAIGATIRGSGGGQVAGIVIGLGLFVSGMVGFVVTRDAHNTYTRYLAHSTSFTYAQPQAAPPPATVRPFVVADEHRPRRTSTGRLDFTPQVWKALFDRALDNDGIVNRDDVAKKCGIGRQWYYGGGYGQFLGELTRLGFIDSRNRLTAKALQWYADTIPLPLAAIATRPPIGRTDGGRTADGREYDDDDDAEEWGES